MHARTGETSGRGLEIQKERTAEAMILHLSGEIDLLTTPVLSSTLTTFAEEGCNVIADLSSVRYIDSIGFKAILGANKLFAERKLRLVLSGPSPIVRRVIGIMQIGEVMPVFSSIEAAREFLCTASAPQAEKSSTSQPHHDQN